MKRLTRSVGAIIAVVGVLFVIRELVRSWPDVRSAITGASLAPLVAGFFTAFVGVILLGFGWRACLAAFGIRGPLLGSLRRYFVGQLGKYVPGAVWSVVGLGETVRATGVAGSTAYGATTLWIVVTYLAAMLTTTLVLATGASSGDAIAWLPVLLLLPIGVLLLHPWVINRGLAFAGRMRGRELDVRAPGWGTSLALLVAHVPAWLAVGAATWLVALALDSARPEPRNVLFAALLSWIVGFLVVPAPGGIGVREAVFVAAATSISSSGVAAAVAVTARAAFVVVDLFGAGLMALVGREANPTTSVRPGQSQ